MDIDYEGCFRSEIRFVGSKGLSGVRFFLDINDLWPDYCFKEKSLPHYEISAFRLCVGGDKLLVLESDLAVAAAGRE